MSAMVAVPAAPPGTPPAPVGHTLLRGEARLHRSRPLDLDGPPAPEPLDQHEARLGRRPRGAAALVDDIELHGLTGRGGGHYPVGAKWRSALRAGAPVTVVANGAESERLSAKDATLLRQRPHLVLDGLELAAEALGARRAVVWMHEDDDVETRQVVRAALHERPGGRVELVRGPDHYLSGESSAIARGLTGGPVLPTVRRRGNPGAKDPARPITLVHNVETLARVALVARDLAPAGTVLMTVLTPHERRVVEVDERATAQDVLRRCTGPGTVPPRAALLGGYGGGWASWSTLAPLRVREPDLRTAGLTGGAGLLAPVPVDACGVAETAAIAGYLASMSARQCGPCLFGLPALADGVRLLAAGTASRGELRRVREDLRAVAGRGACHHPDGAVRLVASALEVFADDVEEHAAGRPCGGRTTIPVPEGTR